jgi:tRNA/rRNA methyltransferase
MARIRVVLVRPENPANVGACARLVRNGGLQGLDLVDPGDWRTVECWRTAWGAQEVLEEARVFPHLRAALGDVGLGVALSGRGGPGPPTVNVHDAARRLASLAHDDRGALVFGPETSGLSNEELACCGVVARIPAHRDQPSFNLSHAVAIATYEVLRASGAEGAKGPRRATHDEKEGLLELLYEGLLAVGGIPKENNEGPLRDWRGLVQRMDLTPRELKLLEHMARKMARSGRR